MTLNLYPTVKVKFCENKYFPNHFSYQFKLNIYLINYSQQVTFQKIYFMYLKQQFAIF